MKISLEEVQKIARLARIELTTQEQQRYAETISAVLEYMTILNEVSTDGVEPTYQITGLSNVTRPDIAEPCPIRQELLEQMPVMEEGDLRVPAVFE